MTASNGPQPHDGRRLYDALSSPTPAPDMTASIMSRLGYVEVSPPEARRARIRRWCRRGSFAMLMMLLVGAGIVMYEQGPHARHPVGPTIPDAIRSEVELHQNRLNRSVRTIRNLVTLPATDTTGGGPTGSDDEPETVPADDRIDEDVDRSAVGPVRWL